MHWHPLSKCIQLVHFNLHDLLDNLTISLLTDHLIKHSNLFCFRSFDNFIRLLDHKLIAHKVSFWGLSCILNLPMIRTYHHNDYMRVMWGLFFVADLFKTWWVRERGNMSVFELLSMTIWGQFGTFRCSTFWVFQIHDVSHAFRHIKQHYCYKCLQRMKNF